MLGDGPDDGLEQFYALLDGQERRLAVMRAYAQDQALHEPRRPRNDVEMTVGDGIETAGVKASARHGGWNSRFPTRSQPGLAPP